MVVAVSLSTFTHANSTTQSAEGLRRDVLGPADVFPAGGFGGYFSSGVVHVVQAQWRVPKISPSSPPGEAATWIGAQNASGSDFIQVGVIEGAQSKGKDVYFGFWSDTKVNFHAQPFGVVTPGELIFASMRQEGAQWEISIRGKSQETRHTTYVAYGAGVHDTAASWIQEDPAPSNVTSKDVPYPVMANVKFAKLLVNGRKPHLALRDGRVLIASTGVIRVPTPVRSDSFTFKAPHGSQRQYLEDARTFDVAEDAFQAELSSWPTTPTPTRRVDANHLILALAQNTDTFTTQTWPPRVRAPLSKLVKVTDLEISDLKSWRVGNLSLDDLAFTKYGLTLRQHEKFVDMVRTSLSIPPLG
jgi:hypothetical protein